jgi:hypothetical protein
VLTPPLTRPPTSRRSREERGPFASAREREGLVPPPPPDLRLLCLSSCALGDCPTGMGCLVSPAPGSILDPGRSRALMVASAQPHFRGWDHNLCSEVCQRRIGLGGLEKHCHDLAQRNDSGWTVG